MDRGQTSIEQGSMGEKQRVVDGEDNNCGGGKRGRSRGKWVRRSPGLVATERWTRRASTGQPTRHNPKKKTASHDTPPPPMLYRDNFPMAANFCMLGRWVCNDE